MSLTTITLRHEWDMGHRLPDHQGKCRRLHGHRYVCEVDVTGRVQTKGSENGMVLDFYKLKDALRKVVDDCWDHRTMLYAGDTFGPPDELKDEAFGIFRVPYIPSAENIAKDLLTLLRMQIQYVHPGDPAVTRVRVYETPNGWAEVRP